MTRAARPIDPITQPGVDPVKETLRPGNEGMPALIRSSIVPHSLLPNSVVPSTIPGSEVMLCELFPELPRVGSRIGRYVVLEVLGQGGMGMVLRARDDILQREVAVKVILPSYLGSDPAAGFRFLREAEIVAGLSHPNIIRVFDAGLDSGIAFIAFEYVQGPSFAEVRDSRRHSVSEAVDVLLPVISAVSYAHRQGIVHGDLKPKNLLLGADYLSRPSPKVLDFGASFLSTVEARLDPARGKVHGTPGYMAPEWTLPRGIDQRADCFSLGCILYELVAGEGPFRSSTRLIEAAQRAREYAYERLSERAACPPEFDAIIRKALEPAPEQRFPSAGALAHALLPWASSVGRASAVDFR
jgi:eukaryotic-like serine/threonine-protein kinase